MVAHDPSRPTPAPALAPRKRRYFLTGATERESTRIVQSVRSEAAFRWGECIVHIPETLREAGRSRWGRWRRRYFVAWCGWCRNLQSTTHTTRPTAHHCHRDTVSSQEARRVRTWCWRCTGRTRWGTDRRCHSCRSHLDTCGLSSVVAFLAVTGWRFQFGPIGAAPGPGPALAYSNPAICT